MYKQHNHFQSHVLRVLPRDITATPQKMVLKHLCPSKCGHALSAGGAAAPVQQHSGKPGACHGGSAGRRGRAGCGRHCSCSANQRNACEPVQRDHQVGVVLFSLPIHTMPAQRGHKVGSFLFSLQSSVCSQQLLGYCSSSRCADMCVVGCRPAAVLWLQLLQG